MLPVEYPSTKIDILNEPPSTQRESISGSPNAAFKTVNQEIIFSFFKPYVIGADKIFLADDSRSLASELKIKRLD